MMEITVNGQVESIEDGVRIDELISRYNLSPKAVIVEYNGAVLTGAARGTQQLSQGDRVELIQIVGGG